jgi:hypothetical protein
MNARGGSEGVGGGREREVEREGEGVRRSRMVWWDGRGR